MRRRPLKLRIEVEVTTRKLTKLIAFLTKVRDAIRAQDLKRRKP